MARPNSKSTLLEMSIKNFELLFDFIEKLSLEEQFKEFPKGTMNRNIADVLMHLHHWHEMMLDWYTVGMNGDIPEMPAKGYTWKTTPELNRMIWEKYKTTLFDDACAQVIMSHNKIIDIIEQHTNEELFEKKRYKWTGSTSLGSYLVSATSSHYYWALKLIKKAKK